MWTQEAYHPPCSKCSLCWSVLAEGGTYPEWEGYLPWPGGTYPTRGGTYPGQGAPTMGRGYLPWPGYPPGVDRQRPVKTVSSHILRMRAVMISTSLSLLLRSIVDLKYLRSITDLKYLWYRLRHRYHINTLNSKSNTLKITRWHSKNLQFVVLMINDISLWTVANCDELWERSSC